MFNDLIYLLATLPIMHFEWLKLFGEDLMPTIILLCFVTLMLIDMIGKIFHSILEHNNPILPNKHGYVCFQ